MALAQPPSFCKVVRPNDEMVSAEPVILNPADLRQLLQAYRELLELHHAEVVDDEDFQDAHRLLIEQVLPLRRILREQELVVVDSEAERSY